MERPWTRPGIITFSSALNSGRRWWNWKTKPMVRLRSSARREPGIAVTSSPARRMDPRVGTSSVPMQWRSVDLPAPEGPTMPSISPSWISRSTPRRTSSVRPMWRNDFWTLVATTSGLATVRV